MKQSFCDLNITFLFVLSGCTSYLQVLNLAINKLLKHWVSEFADIHYEENLDKWENGKYLVGDRQIILTQWVKKVWQELHQEGTELIWRTFWKLDFSLEIDGFKDEELSIKDILNIEVGNWRLNTTSSSDE